MAIQERHRLYREGLAMLLDQEEDLSVVGTAETAADAVRLCQESRPEVLVVEADGDEWAARRLVANVRRFHPKVRVVGLAAPGETVDPAAARRAGFSDVVPRHRGAAGLLDAVRASRPTSVYRTVGFERRMTSRAMLTPREVAVLRLIARGMTIRDMAAELTISPKTVENHKQRMFAKLGVQNQAHAVAVAMRQGLMAAEAAVHTAVRPVEAPVMAAVRPAAGL